MDSRVRLNVGGQVFETSMSTLERAGRDSFLGALVDPVWRQRDSSEDPLPSYWIADRPSGTPQVYHRGSEPYDVTPQIYQSGSEGYGAALAYHKSERIQPVEKGTPVYHRPERSVPAVHLQARDPPPMCLSTGVGPDSVPAPRALPAEHREYMSAPSSPALHPVGPTVSTEAAGPTANAAGATTEATGLQSPSVGRRICSCPSVCLPVPEHQSLPGSTRVRAAPPGSPGGPPVCLSWSPPGVWLAEGAEVPERKNEAMPNSGESGSTLAAPTSPLPSKLSGQAQSGYGGLVVGPTHKSPEMQPTPGLQAHVPRSSNNHCGAPDAATGCPAVPSPTACAKAAACSPIIGAGSGISTATHSPTVETLHSSALTPHPGVPTPMSVKLGPSTSSPYPSSRSPQLGPMASPQAPVHLGRAGSGVPMAKTLSNFEEQGSLWARRASPSEDGEASPCLRPLGPTVSAPQAQEQRGRAGRLCSADGQRGGAHSVVNVGQRAHFDAVMRTASTASKAPKPVPEIFIDRDPTVFRVLLNLLRTGQLDLSAGVSLDAVLCDADYFGIMDCVKGAMMPPPLDANEMEKVHTLNPNVGPTDACTAMCGNDDGSLTVAHGARISAYDWSLDRIATIYSDLPQVDTIQHLSETNIVAGSAKSSDQLPVYDLRASSAQECKVDMIECTGASHPTYRSMVCSDRFLFVASLRKTLGAEWGVMKAVGMVDKETLKSVGEPGQAPLTTRRLGGPDKLQWISSRNLLLVAKRYNPWPGGNHEGTSYVRLWDPRCNRVVWDWREFEEPQATSVPADRWFALCDAVVCEDLNLLFKASPSSGDSLSSRLSAVDLRRLPTSSMSGSAMTVTSPRISSFTSSLVVGTSVTMPPPSSPRGTHAAASAGGQVSTGPDCWSILQWQTPDQGLRIGAPTRDPRYESNVLRLVAVPGSSQVVCNRQPTLEVWSPVARMADGQRAVKRDGSGENGGAVDPFMFRRSFADSREEYNRKRTNCGSLNAWVYDMTMGGDHRLFVVREDTRQGGGYGDYGSIEVWETRQTGRSSRFAGGRMPHW